MSKILCISILAYIVFFSCSHLFGQNLNKINGKLPIELSFGDISVGIPYTKLLPSKIHSFGTIGTEIKYFKNAKINWFQTLKIGGYYSRYSSSSLFLNSEIGFRRIWKNGMFAAFNLGVGYSRLYRNSAIFEPDSTGSYKQIVDYGKSSFMINNSVSLGYNHPGLRKNNYSFFLSYGNLNELFYNNSIPILPHRTFAVGVRLEFKKSIKH